MKNIRKSLLVAVIACTLTGVVFAAQPPDQINTGFPSADAFLMSHTPGWTHEHIAQLGSRALPVLIGGSCCVLYAYSWCTSNIVSILGSGFDEALVGIIAYVFYKRGDHLKKDFDLIVDASVHKIDVLAGNGSKFTPKNMAIGAGALGIAALAGRFALPIIKQRLMLGNINAPIQSEQARFDLLTFYMNTLVKENPRSNFIHKISLFLTEDNLRFIAQNSAGFSSAQLNNVIQTICLTASELDGGMLTVKHMEEALDKIKSGSEKIKNAEKGKKPTYE